VARFASGDVIARVAGPLAIGLGVVTELKILGDNEGSLTWLPPVLAVVGVVAAGALAFGPDARTRNAALATALATLLIAPATWSVQTLGHATSGTFPAGGPASAAMGGPGGGGRGGFGAGQGGPPPGMNGAAPGGNGGFAPGGTAPGGGSANGGTAPGMGGSANSGTAPGANGSGTAPGAGGPGGGAMFGGNSASLQTALDYIKANGGGTLAVSSQSTAAAAITASDADIVGLGGFSGRESEVSVSWLADQVSQGNIRWVLADDSGGGGLGNDGRTGATTAMAAVAEVGTPVDVDGVTLYDLQGTASELAALA